MKKIFALFFNLLMGAVVAMAVGSGGWTALGIGAGLSLIKTGTQGLQMAIQKEIWQNDIVEALWANNQFLSFAFNADQYVLAGKVVHIPQAGTSVSATTNRSSLPASVTTRTDTEINYSLDEITTDPILISNADTVELSYDKRNSVLSDSKLAIAEAAALNILFKWNPTASGNIIRTTGAAVAAHTDSATGTRKAFTVADVKAAAKLMNKQNIPTSDRYMLVDADMYDQLQNDLTATQYRDFSAALNPATGVVGSLYGFNIMMRSSVARYTNATTPVPVAWSTSGAATHNAAALCWHKNSVERALGMVDFFEQLKAPTYYGDIYSALVRVGGRIRRTDANGIIAIVQTNVESVSTELSNLVFSAGSIVPAFDQAQRTYTIAVANGVSSTTITATAGVTGQVIKLGTTTLTTAVASASKALAVGENVFTIKVTSADGSATANYEVIVTRAAE